MIIQRLVLPVSLVAALVFVPGCKKEREPAFFESSRKGNAEAPVKDVPRDILTTQQAFINLVKQVNPAVVNISTISKKKMVRPFFEFSPFFDDFFGDGMSRPQYRRDKSLGSGFIINGDGYIVTNDHVIRDAESIQVKLSNDHVYPAKVIGSDAKTDLAVIKISVKDKLPYAVLGDSDKLQVGQWAVAIGNPFGLDRTVTVGVISATGRSDMGIETYEDFIQTDASINPGNSGGPLLNVYGEVIGINTAIVAAGQGIGFAIPINMAKQVVAQLMTKGNVTRGWLGVSIQPVTEPIARSFGLKEAKGVVVSDVMRGSPAQKAGVKQGDVLLTFDGKEIKDARQLQRVVAETAVGRKAEVQVFRDGKVVKLQVVLGNAESTDALQQRPEASAEDLLGIGVDELPPDLQRRGATGVLVTDVDPAGIAAEGGLQRGDIVQSINQRRIRNLADYTKAMADAEKKGVAAILVRRGDTSLYFAFNLR